MYETFEHTADLGLRVRAPDAETWVARIHAAAEADAEPETLLATAAYHIATADPLRAVETISKLPHSKQAGVLASVIPVEAENNPAAAHAA